MDTNTGDAETFSDVLGLIGEYEGVLNRHESLAANLGAKLTGPRLLKAMEAAFEGPIVTTPPQGLHTANPVGWVDIVQFAKSNPGKFTLTTTADRDRVCQFLLKGVQVEITEDDWRLIMSGALDGFRLGSAQPQDEDESAELATLDIVEDRLQLLIKKADEVARRARQLNYQLSRRKAAITSRRQPQQGHGGGFQAVNQSQRGTGAGSGYDMRADLLQQFLASQPTVSHSHSHSRASSTAAIPQPSLNHPGVATPKTLAPRIVTQSRPSLPNPPEAVPRDSPADDPSAVHRPLIAARIERLFRGDIIHPPCDRCRRLKTQCVKHLTACQGCTKKHAKCSWKMVTDEEVAWIKRDVTSVGEGEPEMDGEDYGEGRSGVQDDGPGEDTTIASLATGSRPSSRGDYRPRPMFEAELGARSRPDNAMDVDTESMERQAGRKSMGGSSSLMIGGHSLLHVASAATARADARDGEGLPANMPPQR